MEVMQSRSASDLLTLWEQGLVQSPIQRAVLLLTALHPKKSLTVLAQFPIGQRDADLFTLREHLFGTQLHSLVVCPACQHRLEFTLAVADLRVAAPMSDAVPVEVDGCELTVRLPTSEDIAAIAALTNPEQALLQRCVIAATKAGEAIAVADLPADVSAAVMDAIAEADPQADVQLDLSCPNCQHTWQSPFDIASFLWAELDAWANRTLEQVHRLARAYGWGEQDILNLTPYRRQRYLERVP